MNATRKATTVVDGLPRDAEGSVLPLVLIGLTALALLCLSAYEAARFALAAARTQASAAAALHAADSGLEIYLRGGGPPNGPLIIEAPPGRATVSVVPFTRLPDSSRVVEVISVGRAPAGASRPVVRRLGVLARLDSIGSRQAVPGSRRERLEDP